MKQLLFLCTGNYYRSRFAEEYFNHHAERLKLDWRADSSGLQRDFNGNGNVGPISTTTVSVLRELGIEPKGNERMPKRVEKEDFSSFDHVVAVSKDEHFNMLRALWPTAVWEQTQFFDVEDLHIEGSDTALPRLRVHLDRLLTDLQAGYPAG